MLHLSAPLIVIKMFTMLRHSAHFDASIGTKIFRLMDHLILVSLLSVNRQNNLLR